MNPHAARLPCRTRRHTFLAVAVCALGFGLVVAPAAARGQDATSPEAVERWVDHHQGELVDRLVDFLRIPNVAANLPDIRRNTDWLVAAMESRGIATRVLETDGAPMVFGDLPSPGAETTILFYCHYDGQPADPDAWVGHSPWEPVLRNGSLRDGAEIIPRPTDGVYDEDWRVYARSASDDKSPIVMLLSALDALRATGAEPDIHIKFLFEGDEEAGSPGMRSLIAGHRDLFEADLVVMADGPQHPSHRPTLVYGARGIVTTRLIVYGPSRPLHSGHFGNWAPNPALRLARLLASMKDDMGRVVVPGFYDDATPLTPDEIAALRSVPADQPADYGFAAPEGGPDVLRLEATSRPSLNVRGLGAGWIGADTRTIVPDSAVAEIDLRLVPDIRPDNQVERLRRHVTEQGYHLVAGPPTDAVRGRHPRIARLVRLGPGYPGMRTPLDHPVARRIARSVEHFTGAEPIIIPMLGGSVPAVWFPVEAGTPVLLLPTVNPDNNQHSPNENLRLGNFFDGITTLAAVMRIGGGARP